jgi:hypothetical protein
VVFVEYNEPPDSEPYLVLCERLEDGWIAGGGGSGGGWSWMWTHDDPTLGSVGVEITWNQPMARWNVPDSDDFGGRAAEEGNDAVNEW